MRATPTTLFARRCQSDHSSYGNSHTYWGYGFHRTYPQYYVTYYYEPVNICETYYFDEGAWFCFSGY